MAKIKNILLFLLPFMLINCFWYFYMTYCVHLNNVHLSSMVKAPVKFALQEIYTNMENAEYDIAEQKMNMLIRDWNSFVASDENISVFSNILYRYKEIDKNVNEIIFSVRSPNDKDKHTSEKHITKKFGNRTPVKNNIYDWGDFFGKENIFVVFQIENNFTTKLYLGKIRTSCTCAEVKYLKSELQPGESTELIVTLKANSLSGPFLHTIYVETDNPKQRFMRFVIKGNAIPLLKVSPEPVQYIGTLQVGKKYEYKYELVPTNPKENISLELIHSKLPDRTDIKLEKQEDKFLLTVSITPQKDQKSISLNFAVKIKEPKDWSDIKFTLNGRIQSSQSEQPKPGKTNP